MRQVIVGAAIVLVCSTTRTVSAQDAGVDAAPSVLVPPALETPLAPVRPSGIAYAGHVDVDVAVEIDAAGHLVGARVVATTPADAPDAFREAAIEALHDARFRPATRDGIGIASRVHVRVVFQPAPAATPDQTVDETAGVHPEHEEQRPPTTPLDSSVRSFSAHAHAEARSGRSASDVTHAVGGLRHVPRTNASDYLRLAPGVFLTNEAGDGHAERVYLRGFDAREGQDLEVTVNGVPVNEAGNPHGEGYADAHFIVPELIQSIRVLEGPFDPHQGNYAVAGSAEYALALDERGLSLRYEAGSFGTHRALVLFGPRELNEHTFAGAELRTTEGFGANRAASLARVMGQYELTLSPTTTMRLLASSYATRFGTAGVVRADDLAAGRIGFFDTYDRHQGGDASRHGIALTIEDRTPNRVLRQLVFAHLRGLRLKSNFTGFLEDPVVPWSSHSAQRGDMTDQAMTGATLGARGSARFSTVMFGRRQSLEVGYYARHDQVDSSQRRLRAGDGLTPYRIDFDFHHAITNIAFYADIDARPLPWLTIRGGVRGESFHFDTLDRCAVHDVTFGSVVVVDELCFSRDRAGTRDPSTRRTASGIGVGPRATVLVGPFEHFTFSGAAGIGLRAADPSYLADGSRGPFVEVLATEGGVVFDREIDDVSVSARALYFLSRTGRDLIFNQQEGRNTLAPGTLRHGFLAAARVTGSFFDLSASATYANARFERETADPGSIYFPADSGDRVPFVPPWVFRVDAAVFGPIGDLVIDRVPVRGRVAAGVSYVSPRALLFNEWSDPLFTIDVSAGARYRDVELGISIQNVTDNRYRLAEFNYASDFRTNAPAPNLVPARHFVAGAPFSFMVNLAVHLFGDETSPASGGADADGERRHPNDTRPTDAAGETAPGGEST